MIYGTRGGGPCPRYEDSDSESVRIGWSRLGYKSEANNGERRPGGRERGLRKRLEELQGRRAERRKSPQRRSRGRDPDHKDKEKDRRRSCDRKGKKKKAKKRSSSSSSSRRKRRRRRREVRGTSPVKEGAMRAEEKERSRGRASNPPVRVHRALQERGKWVRRGCSEERRWTWARGGGRRYKRRRSASWRRRKAVHRGRKPRRDRGTSPWKRAPCSETNWRFEESPRDSRPFSLRGAEGDLEDGGERHGRQRLGQPDVASSAGKVLPTSPFPEDLGSHGPRTVHTLQCDWQPPRRQSSPSPGYIPTKDKRAGTASGRDQLPSQPALGSPAKRGQHPTHPAGDGHYTKRAQPGGQSLQRGYSAEPGLSGERQGRSARRSPTLQREGEQRKRKRKKRRKEAGGTEKVKLMPTSVLEYKSGKEVPDPGVASPMLSEEDRRFNEDARVVSLDEMESDARGEKRYRGCGEEALMSTDVSGAKRGWPPWRRGAAPWCQRVHWRFPCGSFFRDIRGRWPTRTFCSGNRRGILTKPAPGPPTEP